MPEAPRERPEPFRVLHGLTGHVRARPKAVFEAIDARLRPSAESSGLYTADPAAFLIISQGGWWYRGEYRVVPDEFGSHLEHIMLNIARSATGLSRLVGRRAIASAPDHFERLVRELRLELE